MTPLLALKQLRALALTNSVPDPNNGICINISILTDGATNIGITILIKLKTGSSYPIEGNLESHRANRFKWVGESLTKRIELIDNLIQHLETTL